MYPVRRQTNKHAAELRRNATDAERKLWAVLRNRQLGGYKFKFQASVGPFVVDFRCAETMLIVEVDGGQHNEAVDAARTQVLEAEGYRMLRFWNNDVLQNVDGVAEVILAASETGRPREAAARVRRKKKTLTQPSPAKAGEG